MFPALLENGGSIPTRKQLDVWRSEIPALARKQITEWVEEVYSNSKILI